MLVGDGWAFLHIPKCGGTSIRSVLSGSEDGEILPMGKEAPIRSPLHRVPERRPIGCVWAVVRHPADWVRSFWADQQPKKIGVERYPHKYWSDDLSRFAVAFCNAHPGFVSALYESYSRYEDVVFYRLEDGLDRAIKSATGMDVRVPKVNSTLKPELSDEAMALVRRAETLALRKFGYE